jgi:transcriptional regulator with XRE-family HTH domain
MYALSERGYIMPGFRERFLYLQNEKNVTIKEIAECVGVDRTTLSKYVSGRTRLNKPMQDKLSEYFDVDIAYLIGESNVRRQKQQLPEDLLEVCREAANKKISAKKLRAVIKAIIQDNE